MSRPFQSLEMIPGYSIRLGSAIFPSRSHRKSVLLLTPICNATWDVEYSVFIYATTSDVYTGVNGLSSESIWNNGFAFVRGLIGGQ